MILGPLVLVTAGLVVVAAQRVPSTPSSVGSSALELVGEAGAPDISPAGSTAATSPPTVPPVPTVPASTAPPTLPAPATVALAPDDGKAAAERTLVEAFVVSDDDLQPKSIVASGTGLFVAQNMMYRHNVSVFDRTGTKIASIADDVDLAAFGVEGGGQAQGSPVEAAFTPDGRFVYVSNYKMFGDGWNPVADDDCDRGDWDDSYVYKIDTTTFEIVDVIATGAVPKYLAVSPDGSRLVVSNWCGFDVSIIDTTTDTELARVDVGRHPRGVAIPRDSEVAYVTVMGEAKIVVIGLDSFTVLREVPDAGTTPRHIALSPDDRYLYVSNHRMNSVRKIDLQAGQEVGIASTGTETRSLVLSDDGTALYVVNYRDGTMSKVRTSDMEILQTLPTGVNPVGITYDAATRQVWVANYAGTLRVFTDS